MKPLIALLVSLVTIVSTARSEAVSRCGPVVDAARLTFAYECLNDMSFLVTDKSESGWHYALDSSRDGLNGSELGTRYEFFGMAFRESAYEIRIVLNGNMPATGYADSGAGGGAVTHGDLFIDISGLSFATASDLSRLYAVHFAVNDAAVSQFGVYKNVKAKSVTGINTGFTSLGVYKSRVTALGSTYGFGDLPANQTYYGDALSYNAIASGNYAGPIQFLTPAELAADGYNSTVLPGSTTIAFKFSKRLIIDTCGVTGGDGTSCLDCRGVACGDARLDLCGVCGGDSTSCQGCDGVPNSGKIFDLCGVCGGDNSSCRDCAGVPNGGKVLDLCGVCGGDNSSCLDCAGVPNGARTVDACGVCGGDGRSCLGCDGVPNSGKVVDLCGICGGDNSTCKDCAGVPNGGRVVDLCGVCGGDNSSCKDCAGVPNGGKVTDLCGVCGGDNSSCKDCAGVPNGQARPDLCGVCGGDNSSCKDCAGVPDGGAIVDLCGVCGGNSTSCLDCAGVPYGGRAVDACGVCGGDSSSCKDCAGVPNGGARLDLCGVCNGGNSTCLDCAGVPNGGAKNDACGICNGTVTDPSLCVTIQQCSSKRLDKCGVCDGNDACLDCAGVPNGGKKLDCCGVCGGDGSTCLDKCTFFQLKTLKREAKRGMSTLYASVKKYSTQELACNKGKVKTARNRLVRAQKMLQANYDILVSFVADTVKLCDTQFCTRQSFTSILTSLRSNTRALYRLSQQAQYGAGKACKTSRARRTVRKISGAAYESSARALSRLPAESCS